MGKIGPLLLVLCLTIPNLACGFSTSPQQPPTPVETDACCLKTPSTLEETLDAPQLAVAAAEPTLLSEWSTATTTPEALPSLPPIALPMAAEAGFIRQGATLGILDPYQVDDVAAGSYPSDLSYCGEAYLADLPVERGEIFLTLSYDPPLLPEQIEIYTSGQSAAIQRVELLNATSGLGTLIYEAGSSIRRETLKGGICSERLILPAATDFEVDTVLIAFESLAGVAQVGAVEILGRLKNFVDLPAFWRIPLPGTPIDIATGPNGLVYVATEPTGLFAFDVEGNQLKQFSVPSESRLTGVAADPFGNLIVIDASYGRFIVLSPDDEQLTIGGEHIYYAAAVSPFDGNLYLLTSSAIYVYTTDTAELIRKMPLDELHSHGSLAFDPDGRLYTLRDFDWSANLLVLDPLTGEELDVIPIERSSLVEIVARDFAIDGGGNIYILFAMNTGEIAVHMFDPQGSLIQRFGKLVRDPNNCPEGAFFDPRAITVSPDGRFIFVADGFGCSYEITSSAPQKMCSAFNSAAACPGSLTGFHFFISSKTEP